MCTWPTCIWEQTLLACCRRRSADMHHGENCCWSPSREEKTTWCARPSPLSASCSARPPDVAVRTRTLPIMSSAYMNLIFCTQLSFVSWFSICYVHKAVHHHVQLSFRKEISKPAIVWRRLAVAWWTLVFFHSYRVYNPKYPCSCMRALTSKYEFISAVATHDERRWCCVHLQLLHVLHCQRVMPLAASCLICELPWLT
jgi:hypothetical protein